MSSTKGREEFVNKCEYIIDSILKEEASTKYSSGFDKAEDMCWLKGEIYFTDCTGLICGILRECQGKVNKKIYKQILEFAEKRELKDISATRRHHPLIYPLNDPYAVFSEDLYDFVIEQKNRTSRPKRGDIFVTRDSKCTKATGHAMILWRYSSSLKEYVFLECSSELDGIGFVNYSKDSLVNFIRYSPWD